MIYLEVGIKFLASLAVGIFVCFATIHYAGKLGKICGWWS